jgi:hypothetical protein
MASNRFFVATGYSSETGLVFLRFHGPPLTGVYLKTPEGARVQDVIPFDVSAYTKPSIKRSESMTH